MLPPLRERRDDIPRLVRHFTQQFARRMGRRIETIPPAAMDALIATPGRATSASCRTSSSARSSSRRARRCRSPSATCRPRPPRGLRRRPHAPVTLADAEREHILGALRETDWVLGGPKGAAARLGMKRSTLQWKMKKLGISRPE